MRSRLDRYNHGVSNKSNFTVDEWDLFRKVPFLTSLVVISASPSGPVGLFQESRAASEVLRAGLENSQTELMKVLAEDLKENLSFHKMQSQDADEIYSNGLAACREVATVLREKATPEEAGEFKSWLTGLARRVAEAAKEGGFLGFGGTQVTEAESSALDQIEVALR